MNGVAHVSTVSDMDATNHAVEEELNSQSVGGELNSDRPNRLEVESRWDGEDRLEGGGSYYLGRNPISIRIAKYRIRAHRKRPIALVPLPNVCRNSPSSVPQSSGPSAKL